MHKCSQYFPFCSFGPQNDSSKAWVVQVDRYWCHQRRHERLTVVGRIRTGLGFGQGRATSGQNHSHRPKSSSSCVFLERRWETKGTNGISLTAHAWSGEAWVLSVGGYILRARILVSVVKQSKIPIGLEPVGLWKRFTTSIGRSILVASGHGWDTADSARPTDRSRDGSGCTCIGAPSSIYAASAKRVGRFMEVVALNASRMRRSSRDVHWGAGVCLVWLDTCVRPHDMIDIIAHPRCLPSEGAEMIRWRPSARTSSK